MPRLAHEAAGTKADLAMEPGARELGHIGEDVVLKHEGAVAELPVGQRREVVLQAPLLAQAAPRVLQQPT